MASNEAVPFLKMFPVCGADGELGGVLENASILDAAVDRARMTMRVTVKFPAFLPPAYISLLESKIAAEFGLSAVFISPLYPAGKTPGRRKKAVPSPGARRSSDI